MSRTYIVDDPVKQQFLLDREALVSASVLADEMTKIFAKCWIYVGHASELKKPNDFITRLNSTAMLWLAIIWLCPERERKCT